MKTVTAVLALLLATAFAPSAKAASVCVAAADKAQDLRHAGKLRAARSELAICAQQTCNAVVRGDCQRWIREIDEQMPSLVIRTSDTRGREVPGARVTVDDHEVSWGGSASIALDPGPHTVRATTSSGAVAEQTIEVAAGAQRAVSLRFSVPLEEDGAAAPPPAAAPATLVITKEPARPTPVVPLVLGGVGVVALGAFGYFEVSGHSAYADLEQGCGRTRTCSEAQLSDVRGQFVGAGVALGVAVVTLGTAAVMYFAGGAARPATTGMRANGFVF